MCAGMSAQGDSCVPQSLRLAELKAGGAHILMKGTYHFIMDSYVTSLLDSAIL